MGKHGSFICGVFFGTIIGSAVGFLCAPESGEEIREKIKTSTQDAIDDVSKRIDNYGGDIKKYLDDATSGITQRFKDYKSQIESKIQELQTEVNADIAELNEELEELHSQEENQAQNLDTLASEKDD